MRRVAALVADGATATELFGAVAEELVTALGAQAITLDRYEPDGTTTVVASLNAPMFPAGSRWPLDGPSLSEIVRTTGRAARIDDYADLPGTIASTVRESGIRSAIGTPIVVDGKLWGLAWIGTDDTLDDSRSAQLDDFGALVGIAVSNAESRARLERLVAQEASLRRVATLVAEGAAPAEVFAAVAEECARIAGVATVNIARYEPDCAVVVGSFNQPAFPIGSRWPVDGPSLYATVLASGRPARIDDYSRLPGKVAATARASGVQASVGVPIVADGKVWGVIAAGVLGAEATADIEARLAGFTELAASAIARAQTYGDLLQLAGQQAALRRLATLVAEAVPDDRFFAAVVEEVHGAFGVDGSLLQRYGPPGMFTVLAVSPADDSRGFTPGTRLPLDSPGMAATILETGEPARIDYAELPGQLGEIVRGAGVHSGVGVPITVDGALWGVISVLIREAGRSLPADTEARLGEFTELVATAIANIDSRERIRRLADEQAALRRVATLVAEGATSAALGTVVVEELVQLLGVPSAWLVRYEPEGTATVAASANDAGFPVGSSWPLDGSSTTSVVYRTGRPARVDDFSQVPGVIAEQTRASGFTSAAAVPVSVDGAAWGAFVVATTGDEPLPADTIDRLVGFGDLVATAISNAEARDHVRGLVEEQSALRRVATLVAEGATTEELCTAVLEEVVRVFAAPGAWLIRYAPESSITILASFADAAFPVGTTWPLDGSSVSAAIFETGRPARIDDFSTLEGTIAGRTRDSGYVSSLGVPIVVDGEVWGAICIGTTEAEPLPADSEAGLAAFTGLVETAISNADARDSLRGLADQQAALRRVATLVARESSPVEIFHAVNDEMAQILETEAVGMLRFEHDGTATLVAQSKTPWDPPPLGTRLALDGENAIAELHRTGRATRQDDWTNATGAVAAMSEVLGVRSIVAAPIVVEGRLWGTIIAATSQSEPLPADSEARLSDLTDLVATSISNADARDRLRGLADERAALHRVAELVARGTDSQLIFDSVCEEAGRLIGASSVNLSHYTPDGVNLTVAAWGPAVVPAGTRFPITPDTVAGAILATNAPARVDSWEDATSELAAFVRSRGIRSSLGAPVVLEGTIWGALVAATDRDEPLSAGTELRLARFTEIVATAISNAEARQRLRDAAAEQAALRRVATLVARGVPQEEVFGAVAEEVGRLFDADLTVMGHYEGESAVALGSWSASSDNLIPEGTRSSIGGRNLLSQVAETGKPARLDDYEGATGEVAEIARRFGWRSSIAAPIVDEGRVWGVMLVASTGDRPFAPDAEHRLGAFTDLLATSVGNAEAHTQLVASRARIVAAGDEARRRIERNLHDGTQQQLIALGLDLQAVRATVPPDLREAHEGFERMEREIDDVLGDVRELSRGLHPALLSRAGLGPALRALARRTPMPVALSIDIGERPPEPVETCVYYVVAEALTNIAKHAHATSVSVDVAVSGSTLRVSVADDGVGGAQIGPGSGLAGLVDRVEALGGRLELDSRPNRGTRLVAVFSLGVTMTQLAPRDAQPLFALQEYLWSIGRAGHVVEAARDGGSLYVVDQFGRIDYVDEIGLGILGYTAEELRGKPAHDTIHYLRRDGTTFLAADCPLLRPWLTGESVTVDEDWFIAKDGSFVPVSYAAAPLPLPRAPATVIAFRVRPEATA